MKQKCGHTVDSVVLTGMKELTNVKDKAHKNVHAYKCMT